MKKLALTSLSLLFLNGCMQPESSETKSLDNVDQTKSSLTLNSCGMASNRSLSDTKKIIDGAFPKTSALSEDGLASILGGFTDDELKGIKIMVQTGKLKIKFVDAKLSCSSDGASENGIIDPMSCLDMSADQSSLTLSIGEGSYKDSDGAKKSVSLVKSIRHSLVRGLSYALSMSYLAQLDEAKLAELKQRRADSGIPKLTSKSMSADENETLDLVRVVAETMDSYTCSGDTRAAAIKAYPKSQGIISYIR